MKEASEEKEVSGIICRRHAQRMFYLGNNFYVFLPPAYPLLRINI